MDRLQAYLDQVFASVPPSRRATEQKQEMLLDLQDKYRDLLAEGYGREEAYRIVIQGVGDLSELLDELRHEQPYYTNFNADRAYDDKGQRKRKQRAAATPRKHNALIWVIGLLLLGIFVVLPLGALFAMCGVVEHIATDEAGEGLVSAIGDFAGETAGFVLETVDDALDLASDAVDDRYPQKYRYEDGESYQEASGTVAFTEVKELCIEWYGGDVQLVTASGTELLLSEEADGALSSGQALHYRLVDGCLDIRYCAAGQRIVNMPEKTLTLLVPAGMQLEEIEIDMSYGDCRLAGIAAQELSCDTTSADLILSGDCVVNTLHYDAVSGELRAQGDFRDIFCNNISGNVEIDSISAPQQVDIYTVSGDVQLFLPAESSFLATLESVSGVLHCEPAGHWQEGKSILVGDGAGDYHFDSVSGNVDIRTR